MCGRADPASYVAQVSTTIGFKGVKTVKSFLFVVILLKVCFLLQKRLYNMMSKLLAFLYKAGRHLPSGRYVQTHHWSVVPKC